MSSWEVSVKEVQELIQSQDEFLLLDCRSEQERDYCSIEPSLFLPLHDYSTYLDEFTEYKNTPLVIYCHHGVRSLQLSGIMRHFGFTNVKSMAGGIERWSLEVDSSVPRY